MIRALFRAVSSSAAILVTALFVSCDILRDKPFEVASWRPGPGILAEAERADIRLTFTHPPYRPSVEQAFTLREDGVERHGRFLWQDSSMTFLPDIPLRVNRDYEINVDAQARTENGLSLDARFEGIFSTRQGGKRPALIASEPQDGELIRDLWLPLRLSFSAPVDILSCVNEISISPAVKGLWRVEAGGKSALWLPAEPWKRGERYKLTVSPFFESALGETAGKEAVLRWTAGSAGKTPPRLLCAAAFHEGKELFELQPCAAASSSPAVPLIENTRWEHAYQLRLRWDKEIALSSLSRGFSVEPPLKFTIEPAWGDADTAVIRFEERAQWDARYLFKLDGAIGDAQGNQSGALTLFRIRANGPSSRPPELAGIRLPVNPAASPGSRQYETFTKEDLYAYMTLRREDFPFEQEVETWFELYFDTADGAEIDLFSLRERLRIDATNNALHFSQKTIVASGFTEAAGAPQFAGKTRVEVRGTLRNGAPSGVITFRIGEGLQDSYANSNPAAMKLALLD
jgi:hypothetical protein